MNKNIIHSNTFAMVFIILAFIFSASSYAVNFPDKPAANVYYVDGAKIISPATGDEINRIASALLKEKGVPLFVVTIPSLASEGAQNTTIEGYTRALFDFWGVGSPSRNTGIIFLIAKDDRKARIELGASWAHNYDAKSNQIMSTMIVPQFKQGDYNAGILGGVRGLDNMARGFAPTITNTSTNNANVAPMSTQGKIISVIFFIIIIIMIFSLFKSGRQGWAWALIAGLVAFIAYVLWSNRSGGGGSSNNGGGFGGGSSGGGGSTGSW